MHEAGAAVVAAQLLAFYKEPVLYRPRLTHGREPFPGGLHAIRFAQGKFPATLAKERSRVELERLREAAAFFIRQVCLWDGATHYQLLCVPPDARRDAVKDHYHALIALLHPDRSDGAAEHWPAGAAQRANDAYAVLSSDELRRDYDASLRKAATGPGPSADAQPGPHTAAVHTPIKSRATAARQRYRRTLLVVSAVVSGLFFANVWWAAQDADGDSALSAATPFELSARWMREALAGNTRPRYMASADAVAPTSPARAEPTGMLAPLWRALSNRAADHLPKPPAPAKVAAPVTPASPTPLPPPAELKLAQAPSPVPAKPKAAPVPAPAPVVPPAAPARQEPERLAQFAPEPPAERAAAPAGAITSADMEMLVALLVTYYESGDIDHLLGLHDAASIGVWEALRLRHDFQEFFRLTRTRRLRLNKVSWDVTGLTARVTGEATLVAEYAEEPGKLERVVKLEIEAIARDGHPRITRLTLFPHGS